MDEIDEADAKDQPLKGRERCEGRFSVKRKISHSLPLEGREQCEGRF